MSNETIMKFRSIRWIRAIAVLLVFMSWVWQNYYLVKWKGEKEYLLRAEYTKLIEEINVNFFTSLLTTELTKKDDSQSDILLKDFSFKAILHTLNLMLWQKITLYDDSNEQGKLIKEKYDFEQKARELYYLPQSTGNDLVILLNNLNMTMTDTLSYKKENLSKMNRILQNESRANSLFLFLYLIASCLFVLDFFLNIIKTQCANKANSADAKSRAAD